MGKGRLNVKSDMSYVYRKFQKQIPEEGWSEHTLDLFLSWLSSHDTNNRVDMVL